MCAIFYSTSLFMPRKYLGMLPFEIHTLDISLEDPFSPWFVVVCPKENNKDNKSTQHLSLVLKIAIPRRQLSVFNFKTNRSYFVSAFGVLSNCRNLVTCWHDLYDITAGSNFDKQDKEHLMNIDTSSHTTTVKNPLMVVLRVTSNQEKTR